MYCVYDERRYSKSVDIEQSAGVRQCSASSRDGGDEYSSETSEFDSTKNVSTTCGSNYRTMNVGYCLLQLLQFVTINCVCFSVSNICTLSFNYDCNFTHDSVTENN